MGGCLSSTKFEVDPGSVDAELGVTDKQSRKADSTPKRVSKLRDWYICHVHLSLNRII
jgi:hypothetical protein